jgi:putative transcriptional regulator
MNGKINLTGHILVSQPRNEDPYFSQSVVLIAKHSTSGAWGLVVNKPTSVITLDNIMKSAGIVSNKKDKVYFGGPVENNRVHIIHTLDWASSNTITITKDIGITNDMSILAAISQNEGPALFRTCVGVCGWEAGQLEGEYKGEHPWKSQNKWLDAPATIESVFHLTEEDQWKRAIEIVAQNKISEWL